MTVVPGFVDVHIHGAGGHDVMEATPRALDRITSTVARHGTTSIVATTVTAPWKKLARALRESRTISAAMRMQTRIRASGRRNSGHAFGRAIH